MTVDELLHKCFECLQNGKQDCDKCRYLYETGKELRWQIEQAQMQRMMKYMSKNASEVRRMKLTPDEQRICDEYSAPDALTGKVHCHECPLRIGNPDLWDFRCRANSVYNPETNDFEIDYENSED